MDLFPRRKTGKSVANERNISSKKGKKNAEMVGVAPRFVSGFRVTGKGVKEG